MDFKTFSLNADEATRRDFLSNVARSALGVSVLASGSRVFAADSEVPHVAGGGTAKNLIFLYMPGGMTHMDTFDPKSHPDSKGPTDALPTSVPGIHLGHHLPELAKRMDRLAVVRGMSTQSGDHAGGRYAMHTGYRMRPGTKHPHMGSWAQHFLGRRNQLLPDSVIIGGGNPGPGFFDATLSPMPIGDPAKGIRDMLPKIPRSQFDHRLELAKGFGYRFEKEYPNDDVKAYTEFYDETVKFFDDKAVEAFDISKEPQNTREKYGNSRFGQGVLLARRLIEHNVRYVEVSSLGGWDMHGGLQSVPDKVGTLDIVTATLMDDLKDRGLWDETLIVIGSEFGRTPINERGGRDHNPGAFSVMLGGGGVAGGISFGKSDERGRKVAEDPTSVPDLHATMAWALGLPLDARTHGSGGRPFFVGNRGKPMTHLFG
ncbi:MAG: DUF1501 domain-containing protein [Verrucomicrobiota bacterium]